MLAASRVVCSKMLIDIGVWLVIAGGLITIFLAVRDGIAEHKTQKELRLNFDPWEHAKQQAEQRQQNAKKREEARRNREIYRAFQKLIHMGIASPNSVYHRVRSDGKMEAGVVLADTVHIPWYLRCWWTVLQKLHEIFNKVRQNS